MRKGILFTDWPGPITVAKYGRHFSVAFWGWGEDIFREVRRGESVSGSETTRMIRV